MSDGILELVQDYRKKMTDGITPSVARLYSHYARLDQEQEGLRIWTDDETESLLDNAIKLVEASFIEREQGNEEWKSSMRHAGEILEWLSHPDIRPLSIPTHLLASAAYQLAGYPARSVALLSYDTPTTGDSLILRCFLRADFPEILSGLAEYWVETQPSEFRQVDLHAHWPQKHEDFSERIHQLVVDSTLSAMGVLASEMRWGDEIRVDKATNKLLAVSKFLVHSDDPYSWLLAKMCAMVGSTYVNSSLRRHLSDLGLDERGQDMLGRYLRQNYLHGKVIAWPSQLRGIERLQRMESFALCTPTGSGKTTVAEVAILQGLFSAFRDLSDKDSFSDSAEPLVIYLVPSRALAAEVEFKLSQVFEPLGSLQTPIIITGLYGGTDWGPTDAWLTRDTPTVLICTYEKGEALMRFMGSSFLNRTSLVILDEAHSVQFDENYTSLQKAENRSLRLETLSTRLFSTVERNQGRIIALSAVAKGIEETLANWVTGGPNANPAKSSYHSTRQLIGRLECGANRRFKIHYDLLDGSRLRLDDFAHSGMAPYVPEPFPPHPPAPGWESTKVVVGTQPSLQGTGVPPEKQTTGTEPSRSKRLRPCLFWAAVQLAKIQEGQKPRAVLISVPQRPNSYAEDFADLLELWKDQIPSFFRRPQEGGEKDLWDRCLASCRDYFGEKSIEYQLLEKGIVIHHGRMPGLMARLLVEVIQKHLVNLVVATSTLTAGVNLPFEVVLIPSLWRGGRPLSVRELGNLMGRSGRPGFSTEGRSLVLISGGRDLQRYWKVIRALQEEHIGRAGSSSPLAALLDHLYDQWRKVSGQDEISEFLKWLELVSPLEPSDKESVSLIESLDTLDGVLLSAIVELENIAASDLSATELEAELKKIWRRSYAHFASSREQELESFFIQRGKAIVTQIYPSPERRKQLYHTSLPPRSGDQLIELYSEICEYLEVGTEYVNWNRVQCFDYIKGVAERIRQIPKFVPRGSPPGKAEWVDILRWWLNPNWALNFDASSSILLSDRGYSPTPDNVWKWYKYIRENFTYKLNWGIGSFIALALNETFGNRTITPSVDDWSLTELPWIVFWLKELITWGTLDPVAAYLLARARKRIATRSEAERRAQDYYEDQPTYISPDDLLNAKFIRDWVNDNLFASSSRGDRNIPLRRIEATLLRDFTGAPDRRWRVLPAQKDGEIFWFDPAGFLLAKSAQPSQWRSDWLHTIDFFLDHSQQVILSEEYL